MFLWCSAYHTVQRKQALSCESFHRAASNSGNANSHQIECFYYFLNRGLMPCNFEEHQVKPFSLLEWENKST